MPQGIDEDYNGELDVLQGAPPEEQAGPDPTKLKALLMQLMQLLGLESQPEEPMPNVERALAGAEPLAQDKVVSSVPAEGPAGPPPGDKAKQLDAFRSKLKGAKPAP